jgi:hypothetical protein
VCAFVGLHCNKTYPTQKYEKTVQGGDITKRDEINGRGCGTEMQGICNDAHYEWKEKVHN